MSTPGTVTVALSTGNYLLLPFSTTEKGNEICAALKEAKFQFNRGEYKDTFLPLSRGGIDTSALVPIHLMVGFYVERGLSASQIAAQHADAAKGLLEKMDPDADEPWKNG